MRQIYMFEHQKVEFDGGVSDLRDFRITNDTAMAAAFAADLAAMDSTFTWSVLPCLKDGVSCADI